MRQTVGRVLIGVGLAALTLGTVNAANAAGDVVVSVSPNKVATGQPIEVLVRTFRVVERQDLSLPFESPIEPYPVPSDTWNILYSWPDYPFDVVAESEDGTALPVTLARDPFDSTLWRGSMSFPKAGTWTIWVRNFQHKEPGSTVVVTVESGPGSTSVPLPGVVGGTTGAGGAGLAVLIGLLGLLVGLGLGGLRRRRA
jgi:hypothetical protein